MSNLLDAFGTDLDLEETGVWVQMTGDIIVKVRPLGNDKYMRTLERLKKPHQRMYRSGDVNKDIDNEIQIKAICRDVLVDWKGIQDPDTGEELPYSYENAVKLLKDKRIKRFAVQIVEDSSEQETFRRVEEEETEKNLEKSSDGNSTGKKSEKK